MAFTEAQKVQMRKWMGSGDTFRDYNTRLESAFDVVGGRPDTQTEVEAILAKLAPIDAKIDASMTTGGLKRAEDIEWYEGSSVMNSVADVGRMYCRRLATLLGFLDGPFSDAFANGAAMSGGFLLG